LLSVEDSGYSAPAKLVSQKAASIALLCYYT